MYRVAIIGENLGAQMAALACRASGFESINRFHSSDQFDHPNNTHAASSIYSFGANSSRLLRALAPSVIDTIGFAPDRYQIRFGKSAYLLSELPLGDFYYQRYGSGMVNFSAPLLEQFLENQLANPLQGSAALSDVETNHELTILSSPEDLPRPIDSNPRFLVYHATLPDHPLRKANVLWRGNGQYIEQLSDPNQIHFRFVTRADRCFSDSQWHDSLHEALASKVAMGGISADDLVASDTLFAGRVAFLHSAFSPPTLGKIDADNTALEDAWVLSRMMENYEEDIGDGLAAFERFRRPRHRKLNQQMRAHLLSMTEPSSTKRLSQHLGMALKTRLLPEIALQQQDWLYEHDVIKGFR